MDNRPETVAQRKLQEMANNTQGFGFVDNRPEEVSQMKIQNPYIKLPVNMNVQSKEGSTSSTENVVQLAKVDILYKIDDGGVQNIAGNAVGIGGRGGVSHSEQGVWESVKNTITTALRNGRSVSVTFSVDITICHLCTTWFENTV
ncbi:MAG: hypothetical protein ABJL44_13350 [Algibacter sp.]